jgi:hypothetical protein
MIPLLINDLVPFLDNFTVYFKSEKRNYSWLKFKSLMKLFYKENGKDNAEV